MHVIFCLYVRVSDHLLIKINLVGFGFCTCKMNIKPLIAPMESSDTADIFKILEKRPIIYVAVIHTYNKTEIVQQAS